MTFDVWACERSSIRFLGVNAVLIEGGRGDAIMFCSGDRSCFLFSMIAVSATWYSVHNLVFSLCSHYNEQTNLVSVKTGFGSHDNTHGRM